MDEECSGSAKATHTWTMPALTSLEAGQIIVYGGSHYTTVSPKLAASFVAGDRLIVVNDTGDLLHVPRREVEIATEAVGRAVAAFGALGGVSDQAITDFFEGFALRLEDDTSFAPIAAANAGDVEAATRERSYHHPPGAHADDAGRHDRWSSQLARRRPEP